MLLYSSEERYKKMNLPNEECGGALAWGQSAGGSSWSALPTRTCVSPSRSADTRLDLQMLSTLDHMARQSLDEARPCTVKRDKTLTEKVHAWGVEYRSAKKPVESAILEPGFANIQKEAINKQMLLPRRSTIQKDLPQWFQQNAKNMPDWCVHLFYCESRHDEPCLEYIVHALFPMCSLRPTWRSSPSMLRSARTHTHTRPCVRVPSLLALRKRHRFQLRRELDSAQKLDLFQRSESGSLTRFKTAHRSVSTEPYMDTAWGAGKGIIGPYQSRDVRMGQGMANGGAHVSLNRDSPSRRNADAGSLSPLKDGRDNMLALQLQKEIERRDEELMKHIAQQVSMQIPSPSTLSRLCISCTVLLACF